MAKYAFLIFAAIAVVLYWIYFGLARPAVYAERPPVVPVPHRYDKPGEPIRTIHLLAVYFVPKNKEPVGETRWKNYLLKSLEELKRFHAAEFMGASAIDYAVYPEPIRGEKENLSYDTNDTSYGNPEGLRRVAQETEHRLLSSNGDLYDGRYIDDRADYRVLYILYEGVGASGSEDVALLSRKFLTEAEYESVRSTLFAHEFYHTLGIPDGYDLKTSVPFESDIMGLGRGSSLSDTYLSKETLVHLGL